MTRWWHAWEGSLNSMRLWDPDTVTILCMLREMNCGQRANCSILYPKDGHQTVALPNAFLKCAFLLYHQEEQSSTLPLSLGGPTAVSINTAPCKAALWLWVWAINPMLLSPSRSLRPSLFGHCLLVCSLPEQPPCRLCHYPHGVAMGRCTSRLSLALESYQPR